MSDQEKQSIARSSLDTAYRALLRAYRYSTLRRMHSSVETVVSAASVMIDRLGRRVKGKWKSDWVKASYIYRWISAEPQTIGFPAPISRFSRYCQEALDSIGDKAFSWANAHAGSRVRALRQKLKQDPYESVGVALAAALLTNLLITAFTHKISAFGLLWRTIAIVMVILFIRTASFERWLHHSIAYGWVRKLLQRIWR